MVLVLNIYNDHLLSVGNFEDLYPHTVIQIEMGKILIALPDDVEESFRMEVGRRNGVRRGALTEAVTQAIEAWMQKQRASNR
jgi:hypothetical protein